MKKLQILGTGCAKCTALAANTETAAKELDMAYELEKITDLNRLYLEDGTMSVEIMGRGFAWLDTGTHASLLDAATYVRITEERQGLKICCPEEIAWRQGFITADRLREIAQPLRKSGYGEYLLNMLESPVLS